MDYITLKQFIYTIDIRHIYFDNQGKEIKDNEIIRLHLDVDGQCDFIHIDIGWDDFSDKNYAWYTLTKFLNEDILKSVVTNFKCDSDLGLEVFIKLSPFETLEQYKN